MAIDTLFFMGPAAKPLLPLLLDYAGSIGNESNRHLAYRTAGKIDSSLRSTVPGVDEATFQKLAAGAKQNCPLSKALASVPEITLTAVLRS